MAGGASIGRRGILALGAVAALGAVTALGACAPASREADGEKGGEGRDRGSTKGSAKGGGQAEVHTDPAPLERRFTLLGPLTDVHWLGTPLGEDSRMSVPGPVDTRVVGAARLEAGAGAALVAVVRRDFRPGKPERLPKKLAAFMPEDAEWVRSETFNQEVTGGRYTGEFYIDAAADRVYFDTIDPNVAASTGP
ncbi:hypothetical protein [Streptomyces sp. NPDC006267]|uniref:hypothetical protein n=1 Tax=Streptomyces sp. NPDC006267 TaxID=3157173 RepID=UPI0033AC292C